MAEQDLDALQQTITSCERRVWNALAAGDGAADATLLSPHFLGVYPDGFAGKQEHYGQLDHGPTIYNYELQDIRLIPLGPNHALLSYRASFQRNATSAREIMYVSSVWQKDDGGWINIFSQDKIA